jgi:hypothetical protein
MKYLRQMLAVSPDWETMFDTPAFPNQQETLGLREDYQRDGGTS